MSFSFFVISVDNSGNLKANAIGQATITAKTSNGKTATATVYSDVESIKLTATKTQITKYNGGTSSTSLSVTVTPNVDASLIKWSAPDASGQNAAAYFSGSGKSATITARDAWGSNPSKIPVKVSVGRKTSNQVDIYVEPKLVLTPESVTLSASGASATVTSNISVSWSLGSTSDVTVSNVNKQSTSVSFNAVNTRRYPAGFQITATSNAGQTAVARVTVPVARS